MTSRELFIKELSLYDRASDGHDEFYAQWQYYQSPPVQGKSSGHY